MWSADCCVIHPQPPNTPHRTRSIRVYSCYGVWIVQCAPNSTLLLEFSCCQILGKGKRLSPKARVPTSSQHQPNAKGELCRAMTSHYHYWSVSASIYETFQRAGIFTFLRQKCSFWQFLFVIILVLFKVIHVIYRSI